MHNRRKVITKKKKTKIKVTKKLPLFPKFSTVIDSSMIRGYAENSKEPLMIAEFRACPGCGWINQSEIAQGLKSKGLSQSCPCCTIIFCFRCLIQKQKGGSGIPTLLCKEGKCQSVEIQRIRPHKHDNDKGKKRYLLCQEVKRINKLIMIGKYFVTDVEEDNLNKISTKSHQPQNKQQKGVISFKFPRITSHFRDTDTSDFVIKAYQRSTREFKTTKLTFIDSEDINNPKRKEYILSENDNSKLRDLKMAIRRTYIIAPFTISNNNNSNSNNQPLENDDDDKLKIFLDKNKLGKYYACLSSSGVEYEDLTIFVEDESAVDEFIQGTFHKKKLIRAIKAEFNC